MLSLFVVMSSIILVVESTAIGILYNTSITIEKSRLGQAAKSQARLIEAVARFDKENSADFPHGARQATLSQIKEAHSNYRGLGKTGEFTLSTRESDQIVFLLSHRHHDLDSSKPVPWNSGLAEPMRQALSGKSGTMIGIDYRGEKVLAAYEPVAELNLGIVAKIDLSEVRAPYVDATLISGFITIVVIALMGVLLYKITNPIVTGLRDTVARLEKALREVKTLRGILPICSYCKKIRDDEGYWNQVEDYVRKRSDANFSHGICPSCIKKHFPEEYAAIQRRKKGHDTADS